ncbi:hypothetical protein CAP35_13885 [Chitinophagaceae bacterium IBVUCB1]|nr:hypothetical protein CAP35_13885 [Chitinophagaceae bacterium IBVUCB1]
MSNIKNLTPEEKEELRRQFMEEEKQKGERTKQERKNYKTLVNTTIPVLFKDLMAVSANLSAVKKKVFDELKTLVSLKAELYDAELDQFSHSFTTEDGITIIIGHRYNDGWDDTVNVGIEKVEKFVSSMGKDANSKALVKTILQLLAKDKTGVLKASRVIQLKKLADDTGNQDFIDAIEIIQSAHRPVKTKEFVTVRYIDNDGNKVDLPLDISAADFEPTIKQDATPPEEPRS